MSEFTYTGTITYDTIAVGGLYDITASGAQGGASTSESELGGKGAAVGGDIYLASGTVLEIVVGGQGTLSGSSGGGGGGGSYVFETLSGSLMPIEIAGGGGGAGYFANGGSGGIGTIGGDGGGTSGGVGGSQGQGGRGGFPYGGGGGGYTGGFGSGGGYSGGSGSTHATTFSGGTPGIGGGGGGGGGAGGFGGGGGGGASGGGGGGGFGGVGGGGYSAGGGGGGSFLSPDLTHTFAHAGTVTGDGTVSIVPLSQTFGVTGTIDYTTIAMSGTYALTAIGAQGGNGDGDTGGYGAEISGDIYLTQGTVLEIVVGEAGGSNGFEGGGGGGGSFVFDGSAADPIIVAGGGGGVGEDGGANNGGPGLTGPTGGSGLGRSAGAGGVGPAGGGGGRAAGGGGYTGGAGSIYLSARGGGTTGGPGRSAGTSFAGGAGGIYNGNGGAAGGFGGGGGGGYFDEGGGGGGYGGGGGGGGGSFEGTQLGTAGGGGGGGSYDADLTNVQAQKGENGSPNGESNGEIVLDYLVCYLHGTRILTPTGAVAVEELAIGDAVVTRFSGTQRIKFLGRQSYAAEFIEHNPEKWPVRITPGALADGVPARDLYVSPGHSMLHGGTLVLAANLVNGLTITQTRPETAVHYVQIELGAHDCVLADGAWAETYADAPGLRAQFHNAAEFHALYPDAAPPEQLRLCAPRPERGTQLHAALAPVVARAAAAPGPLKGWLEAAGGWKITGWALDLANPERPVLLEILLAGQVIGTVLACEYRKDLALAGEGSGRCAFRFIPPQRLDQAALQTLEVRRAADAAALPGADRWRRVA